MYFYVFDCLSKQTQKATHLIFIRKKATVNINNIYYLHGNQTIFTKVRART